MKSSNLGSKRQQFCSLAALLVASQKTHMLVWLKLEAVYDIRLNLDILLVK